MGALGHGRGGEQVEKKGKDILGRKNSTSRGRVVGCWGESVILARLRSGVRAREQDATCSFDVGRGSL